jgi:hypothetical protein
MAESMSRLDRALIDAQFDAILRNDEIDRTITLPDRISLDYGSEQLDAAFSLSLAVWQEGWSPADLATISRELSLTGTITPENQLLFKHIRARFKQIRFSFAMFSANHRYPLTIDLITSVMGNLQDAFKNGKAGLIRRDAFFLRLLLGRWFTNLTRHDVGRFRPSGPTAFKAYIQRQMQDVAAALAPVEISAKTYHDTRKIISRHRAAFSSLNLAFPSEEHHRVALYLATINGIMGNYHDELMAQKLDGVRDYHRDTEPLDPDLRMRLESLSAHMLAACAS